MPFPDAIVPQWCSTPGYLFRVSTFRQKLAGDVQLLREAYKGWLGHDEAPGNSAIYYLGALRAAWAGVPNYSTRSSGPLN